MPRAKIQVAMDDADFAYLFDNAAEWGPKWEDLTITGRFRSPARDTIDTGWKWAYWFGGNHAAVLLARGFLDAWGHAYQVITDEGSDGGWVILTDYAWTEGP